MLFRSGCESLVVTAHVTGPDTVTIFVHNGKASGDASPAEGKFTVLVTKLKTLNE